MNLHVFCKYLSVMLLLQGALSKMLPAIDGLNSEIENVKSEDTAKEQEIHSKKMDGYNRAKRAIEDSLNKRKQCAVMYKNEEPVGILQSFQGSYRLLPIHKDESFPVDISPIQKAEAEEIEKRDTETQAANAAEFIDEKYPYIFAKFKIDAKLENQKGTKSIQKRDLKHNKKKPALLSSKHMNSLSSTLSKMKANEDGAESALKSVLHDMGLIDDSHIDEKENGHTDEKRDNAQADLNDIGRSEDTDKHSDDKLDIVQDDNKLIADRKREESQHGEEKRDNAQVQADNNDNTDESHHAGEKSDKSFHAEEKRDNTQGNDKFNADQKLDNPHQDEEKHDDDMANEKSEDDSRSDEKRELNIAEDEDLELGTNKIEDSDNERPKREHEVTRHYDAIAFPEPKSKKQEQFANEEYDVKESESVNRVESNEGEHTAEHEGKQTEEESEKLLFDDSEKGSEIEKQTESVESNEREKRSEDVEKQMELQIKQRLQKIKQEVKNEIEQLKGNNNKNDEEFDDDIRDNKDKEKAQRKKRNAIKEIGSLEDQETSELDPVLFGDNNMAPHIRTRRRKRRSLDADRQYARFEKTINEETFKRNIAPLVEEKITDSSLMLRNMENPSNLVIDLNSQITVKADKRTNFFNNNRKTHDSDSRPATTNSYLIRSLKEYRGDFNSNYDDDTGFQTYDTNLNGEEDESSREKKACEGKDCKPGQPNPPRHLTNMDGSNIVYFDGAPVLAESPPSESKIKASMQILPSKGNSEIKTNILRGLRDGGYMLDLDPDIYKLTKSQEPREKRQTSFIDLVAIHGGGPVLNHLLAIRKRSMLPTGRVKRSANANNNDKMLSLTDMSAVDLFGELPQSYEGELARYKRVKREK